MADCYAPEQITMLCSRPSFLRKQEGGFTFQVQHAVPKYLCRGSVSQALARGIVVGLNQLRKPLLWHRGQVSLAGQSPAQPANGILHAALLPGGVGIAEEGLDPQLMEAVMAGELGPVIEGHRPAPGGGHLPEQVRQGARDGAGGFARGPEGEEEAGVTFVQGQHRLAIGSKEHQVGLPVPGRAAVSGALGALGKRAAQRHEGGRTAPLAAAPAPLPPGPRQVVSPPLVLRARKLPVEEPVDALVGDDPPARLHRKPPGHLLRRPALCEMGEHPGSERSVPLQP